MGHIKGLERSTNGKTRFVPTITYFRCYWCLRLLVVVYQSWDELHFAGLYADPTLFYADPTLFYADAELLLVRGCETYVALLGMTSVISCLSTQIGIVFQVSRLRFISIRLSRQFYCYI